MPDSTVGTTVTPFTTVWERTQSAVSAQIQVRGEVQQLSTSGWFDLVDVTAPISARMRSIRTVVRGAAGAALQNGSQVLVTGTLRLEPQTLGVILDADAATAVPGAARLTQEAQLRAARSALRGTAAGRKLAARKPAKRWIPEEMFAGIRRPRVQWISPKSSMAFGDVHRDGAKAPFDSTYTRVSFTDPAAIAAAVSGTHDADVIVLFRGGGGWRDWISLNDQQVIDAVATSSIPVFTGIGHFDDAPAVTYVAAAAFATPTAVADALRSHLKRAETARARAAEARRRQDAQAAAAVAAHTADRKAADELRAARDAASVARAEHAREQADHRVTVTEHARDLRTLAMLRIGIRSALLAVLVAALMVAAPFLASGLSALPVRAAWWDPTCEALPLAIRATGVLCLIGLARSRKRAATTIRRPKVPGKAVGSWEWVREMRAVRTPRAYRTASIPVDAWFAPRTPTR